MSYIETGFPSDFPLWRKEMEVYKFCVEDDFPLWRKEIGLSEQEVKRLKPSPSKRDFPLWRKEMEVYKFCVEDDFPSWEKEMGLSEDEVREQNRPADAFIVSWEKIKTFCKAVTLDSE